MLCYRESAAGARLELRRLQDTPDLDREYVIRQTASLGANIEEHERQERYAAMNAAKGFANVGDLTKIEPLVLVAAQDPDLAEEIGVLRQYLATRAGVARTP